MADLMTPEYISAHATARSCLASLADVSVGEDACRFEGILVELDAIHGGAFPPTYQLVGRRCDLLLWLQAGIGAARIVRHCQRRYEL